MFLEHINMTVSDLDRSVAFYTELLGISIRWQGKTTGGQPAAHIGDDRHYPRALSGQRARPAG